MPLEQTQPTKRSHLDYLDGLRGLAAIYVVLSHIGLDIAWEKLPRGWGAVSIAFSQGLASVAIFIILSGYCLMLPLARVDRSDLPNGFWHYMSRRAWRILPPYYFALLVSLGIMVVVPAAWVQHNRWWYTMWPISDWRGILTHVFQLHNLFNSHMFKINGPMWSVATEWQIYFLFPLVLLPIRKRTNLGVMILAAFAMGIAPIFIFRRFELACPWFLGLFALGMVAACIAHRPRSSRPRSGWLWTVAAIFSIVALVLADRFLPQYAGTWKGNCVNHVFIGCGIACLLISFAWSEKKHPVAAILSAKPLVFVGTFSYSLYLIHAPIIGFIRCLFDLAGLSPSADAVGYLVAGIAGSLIVAYIFFLGAELPFLRIRSRAVVATKQTDP